MALIVTQRGKRKFSDGRKIASAMAFAHAAVVFAESHIKHPMHGLHSPVSPRRVSKVLNGLYPGTDNKVATFNADLALDLLLRLDHADGSQFLPVIAHRGLSIQDTSATKATRRVSRR